LLINLDSHPDRTLGARALDCTIVAHFKTLQAFRTRPTIFKGQGMETGSAWEAYSDSAGMRWAPPDITFSDRMSLFWGGPEILLEYHPGPTAGAIWVVIPAEKVVFVGDAVTPGQPPFLLNAELEDWIESLEILKSTYAEYTIVSGRAGLVTIADVAAQQHFIKVAAQALDRLVKQNAPPDATEDLLAELLAELPDPGERKDVYVHRLRHGLFSYFARRYHSAETVEPEHIEDIEP
jgi:glyoxylase-like metal-dependent hydrolase (beta-lactamase superfamily II)